MKAYWKVSRIFDQKSNKLTASPFLLKTGPAFVVYVKVVREEEISIPDIFCRITPTFLILLIKGIKIVPWGK